MAKIGIMGGSFNPIHVGHILLAQYALEQNGLDEVWFIPTGCSYMKPLGDILPGEMRLTMTERAVSEIEGYEGKFRCLDIEVKRAGNSYTFETLKELKALYPMHDFYFIMGADCLLMIEKWREPESIFRDCTLIAVTRSGFTDEETEKKAEELREKFGAKIVLFPFLQLEISSTALRARIREGKSVKFLVPDSVIDYIDKHQLYRE